MPVTQSDTEKATTTATRIVAIDYGVLSLVAVATGSLVVAAWLALGMWQVRRIRAQAKPAPPELVALLGRQTAGDRTPELGVVEKLPVAAAVGLRRPMILLPQDFLDRTATEKLHTVLAHELAHIRNRDLWLLALLRGLLLVLWPHPLYWLWRRGVRLDQETLADAAAAEVTGRTDYAEQLVAWARVATTAPTPRLASSVGLWESPSQLRRRVAILLDEKLTVLRACSRRWRVASRFTMLLLAIALSVFTLQPAPQSTDASELSASEKTEQATEGNTFNSIDLIQIATPPTELGAAQPVKQTDGDQSASPRNIAAVQSPLYRKFEAERKPNQINGVCVDPDGQPLAGVSVTLYSRRSRNFTMGANKKRIEITSDAQGKFRFEQVVDVAVEFPEGIPEQENGADEMLHYSLIARAKGRASDVHSALASDVVQRGETVVWVLRPASLLRGRIIDDAGQPVAGAQVMVGLWRHQLGEVGKFCSAVTDAEGRYEIDDIAEYDNAAEKRRWVEAMRREANQQMVFSPGEFPGQVVLASHPKYATRRVTLSQVPGVVDVSLLPGATITGQVKYPAGTTDAASLKAGVVTLLREPERTQENNRPDPYSYQTQSTQLDENGRFKFGSLPPGTYRVSATVRGWLTPGVAGVEVKRGETKKDVDVLLSQGVRVQLQLVDSKTNEPWRLDKPMSGFVGPHPTDRNLRSAYRDNRAEFSAAGVAEVQVLPGEYLFYATVPNFEEAADLIPDQPREIKKWKKYVVRDKAAPTIEIPMRVQRHEEATQVTAAFSAATVPSESGKAAEKPKDGKRVDASASSPTDESAKFDSEQSEDGTKPPSDSLVETLGNLELGSANPGDPLSLKFSGGAAVLVPAPTEDEPRPGATALGESAWTPSKNPDPRAIKKEAAEDARQDRYAISLAKQVWYHENALTYRPSQSAVRLSFALSQWLELGEVYPPALAKMKEFRDAAEARIRDPEIVRVRFPDFQEFASFNEKLREQERTWKVFQWLDQTDQEDAQRMFRVAKDSLLKQQDYALYGKYINPWSDTKKFAENYRRLLQFADTKQDEISRDYAERKFLEETATLVAVLVKLDRAEEAQQVADEAQRLIQDEDDMRKRLAEALRPALTGKLPQTL